VTPIKTVGRDAFHVEIIKPSHYDDDGYVIQWIRAFIPSNSLACLYALAQAAAERRALGPDTDVTVSAYDESNTVIPVQAIIRRVRAAGGLVILAGVQTNQFPRAADLARQFRAAGVAVALGGFHVSGCLAMLPEIPPEMRELQELGVALFAGEAEGRMAQLLADAHGGRLRTLYDFINDLPDLRGQEMPSLPPGTARRSGPTATFDAGRGCPFQCTFCTIINVQGRKSRYREADDVERLVRQQLALGVSRFFITDDDMARNSNWEAIFDRLIALREQEGWTQLKLTIQVDTQCHKVPRFIEKAIRAGCVRVFIGMESVNPENLAASKKGHNHVGQYRKMLQAWRTGGVLTQAGYIIGFPADTPESVERDIRTIQRELPVDILEFFMMTPLPGSADHRDMFLAGKWLEPDLNRYDSEHAASEHPRMSAEEWKATYDRAWHLYYSPEHVETLLRRAHAGGAPTSRRAVAIFTFYGSYRFEKVHPLQSGAFRRKIRSTRRPGSPADNPLLFYARRAWEIVTTYASAGLYYLWLRRLRRRVERDPAGAAYTDEAIAAPPAPLGRGRGEAVTLAAEKAKDPVGFKKERARRNEEALARLAGGPSPSAKRMGLPIAPAPGPAGPGCTGQDA
jgi:hypothetical protein